MANLLTDMPLSSLILLALECWNELILLILAFSMLIVIKRDRTDELIAQVEIPLTKELVTFFLAVFVYNLFDVACTLFGDTSLPCSNIVMKTGVFGYYAVGGFQTVFLLQVVKNHIAEKFGQKKLSKGIFAVQLLNAVNFFLLAITPFTQALYYIDESNSYKRSWGYNVWQGVTIASFMFIGFIVLIDWQRIGDFLKGIIVTAVILPMTAFIGSLFLRDGNLNNVMVVFTVLIMFVLYEKNKTSVTVRNVYELQKAQIQLAQSKNDTLMAQIQPHFINNSLMAIRAQCIDYPSVYESMTDFSRYLRSHFEVMGTNRFISFEQEMENIEAYISLEKRNYGDNLRIVYDIDFDDFMIPALSVQPLVENAIRHGVGTYDEGGTVTISVHKCNDNIVIEVTDDGSGKSSLTDKQSARKGIGIDNVRSRLSSMIGGTLEIVKNENGTTARVTISGKGGNVNDNSDNR